MNTSQNNLFQQANEAFNAGKLDQAEQLCRQQLNSDNNDAQCHHLIALCNMHKGNKDSAEAFFLQAIALDATNPEFSKHLGDLYLNSNQIHNAMQAYDRAIQVKPDYFEAHANLGNAYLRIQQADNAIACFKKALQFRPEIAALYDNLGNALKAAGNHEEAALSHKKAIELAPQLISAYINLSNVYREQEKPGNAAEILKKALEIAPQSADVHFSLAEAFALRHQFSQALPHFRKARQSGQYARLALIRELTMLEKIKDDAQAKALLSPYAIIRTSDSDIALRYSHLAKTEAEVQASISDLEKIYQNQKLDEKQQQRILFRLGNLNHELNNFDHAFKYFQSGNDLSKHTWNAQAYQQYIDYMLESCNRETLNQLPTATNDSELAVFIVGLPRSGKSLLEQLLAMHPNITGAGELANIGTRLGLKTDYEKLNFVEKLLAIPEAKMQQVADNYIDECKTLSAPSTTRLLNTMPLNFYHLGLISRIFPNAKIIHIQRNPLDNCLACFTKRFANQQTYAFTNQLEDIGHFYLQHLRLIDHWADNIDIPVFKVSYENLVTDTENTLNRVLNYLEVEGKTDYQDDHLADKSNLAMDHEFDTRISDEFINNWKNYEQHLKPLIDLFKH